MENPSNASISSPVPKAAAPKKSSGRKSAPAKKTKAAAAEKRLKRYRDVCPVALQERLERAATQRLYLIHQSEVPESISEADSKVDFTVLGSTGNVYKVQFGKVPTCNCPDFHRRADMCKHIMFILLKVMGLSASNPLSYQKAYLTSELEELYTILRTRRVGGSILANAQVRAAALHPEGTPVDTAAPGVPRRLLTPDDSDCPICFDTLLEEDASKLTYCRGTCGANFHAACLTRWLRSQSGHQSSCPNCRQPWVGAENPHTTLPKDEAYTNLGALQGQSPVRDTSTYHSYGRKKTYRRG